MIKIAITSQEIENSIKAERLAEDVKLHEEQLQHSRQVTPQSAHSRVQGMSLGAMTSTKR